MLLSMSRIVSENRGIDFRVQDGPESRAEVEWLRALRAP